VKEKTLLVGWLIWLIISSEQTDGLQNIGLQFAAIAFFLGDVRSLSSFYIYRCVHKGWNECKPCSTTADQFQTCFRWYWWSLCW
jgi:hypothetical protein